MTTARTIISDAMTFGLNVLSPGEALDSDTAAMCLRALNSVVDEIGGQKSLLYRDILTASGSITGAYGTLGTDWAGLVSGDQILGATIRYGTAEDVAMSPLTMEQYQAITDKTVAGDPSYYAHDGGAKVYLYPVAAARVITLRTREAVSDFADLDTDYTLPKGYRSSLAAMLADRVEAVLKGAKTPWITGQARAARMRLGAQTARPAILNAVAYTGTANISEG